MEYKDLKILSQIIIEDESYLRKLFSVIPLSKDLVTSIITNKIDHVNLSILLYMPKFYQYIDQKIIDNNYDKFIGAIKFHLEGYRPIDFEDEEFGPCDTYFYDSLIQNSFTLSGIEFVFNDDRDEDYFHKQISSASNSSPNSKPDYDLPF